MARGRQIETTRGRYVSGDGIRKERGHSKDGEGSRSEGAIIRGSTKVGNEKIPDWETRAVRRVVTSGVESDL